MKQPRKLKRGKARAGRGGRKRASGGPTSSRLGAAQALLELTCTAPGEWDASIRRIVQYDAEVIHVERVSFWSLRDETTGIHCEAGYVASSGLFERGATILRSHHAAYFNALREARILEIEDVGTDARMTRELRAYCAAHGISSKLDVPVWVDGQLAGVLCHEQVGARRSWKAGDEDFAAGVGQVVASALAVRAQTSAEAGMRRAAFLDDVSRLILQSLDVQQIATRVLGLVVPRLADSAAFWTLNREGALEYLGSTDADPHLADVVVDLARVATRAGVPRISTNVVVQGQSLLVPSISPAALKRAGFGPRQRARFAKLGVRTAMVVPLAVAGKASGAVMLFARSRHYGSDDLQLAEDVAERVAAALENARLYEMTRDAVRSRDDFLLLASHELRTPLAALQLISDDVLRRGHSGPATGGQAIATQVRRLSALVQHMVDALQIRADGITLALESCDLATIVEECVKRVARRARRAGSAMRLRAESPLPGRWDRARVALLVDDLLDNALKFGAGKPIEIDLRRDEPGAVLRIRDHGMGIPPALRTSIFAPFERGVPKEHFGGLGLGLYIAKAIAEAHRGSIAVTSRVGKGSTFVVRLPLDGERDEAT
jgi:signal transduction histidine kinase